MRVKLAKRLKTRSCGVAALATGALLVTPALALADVVGPITFEQPAYAPGDINGQDGWGKAGPYDSAVADLASFPDASGYGFGSQALRISNAVTSGSFGDQTFSPGLSLPAGESGSNRYFEASFSIGTASANEQPGLTMSVSPDDGSGSRMSYLRFEDRTDGVHVFFDDATNPGPLGDPAAITDFNETELATLDRGDAHRIRFSLALKPGPANDVARIYIDGKLQRLVGDRTGTTWEDYYRFDPEQNGNGNLVPTVSKLLFRESGTSVSGNSGKGFLVDGVSLSSRTRPADRGRHRARHKADDQGRRHGRERGLHRGHDDHHGGRRSEHGRGRH
jgi:hypothetical protein